MGWISSSNVLRDQIQISETFGKSSISISSGAYRRRRGLRSSETTPSVLTILITGKRLSPSLPVISLPSERDLIYVLSGKSDDKSESMLLTSFEKADGMVKISLD